jgi:PKD repeat protein
MKKFLLSMIAIFAMSLCSFAQISVCDNPCPPATEGFSTGVVPYSPTTFPTMYVGQYVEQCITIQCPESALGATVDSIWFKNFIDVPNGLNFCISDTMIDALEYCTVNFSGTPTVAGDFALKMRAHIYGSGLALYAANFAVDTENGYSTGITLTVHEAGAVVANFSTNPATSTDMTSFDFTQAVRINEGGTVEYTNQSSGAHHIAWTFEGGAPATSTENNVTVTYATAGTYTSTLIAYNEDETVSDTASVTVKVSVDPSTVLTASFTTDPAATGFLTQSVTIEQGQTVAYTNTSSNAHHIAWSFPGGDPATSTNDEVTVTYNTVGSFTTQLIAYNEGETDSDTATLTITVNASAENAVTADFTTNPEATSLGGYLTYIAINQGETVTFTNASSANTHHIAWSFEGGSPATSTEDVVTVTYAEAGTYFTATLTAYNEDETISNTKSIYVTVASVDPDAVEANFTTDPAYTDLYIYRMLAVETGTTVTYTSTCNENTDHIAWTFEGGNPATSTNTTVAVAYTTAGSYTTTLVAYNADETRTDTLTLSVTVTDPVAVEENAISEISVYPNPTSSIINIAAEGMQNITIIDMTGRVVMSKDVNSNFETISAEGFAKANYMVRITTADGVVVKNIVVE